MAIILGIDPGSLKTGFGLVNALGGRCEYVASGVIRLPKAELPERLQVIFASLLEVIEEYCPQEMAIESVFMSRAQAQL